MHRVYCFVGLSRLSLGKEDRRSDWVKETRGVWE